MNEPETMKQFMHYAYGYLSALVKVDQLGVKVDVKHVKTLLAIMETLDDFEPEEKHEDWNPFMEGGDGTDI